MRRASFAAGLAAWVTVVGTGFGWLALYESRPGPAAESPGDWPSPSRLSRDPGRWTLVMFLHPRCPCSRASLDELGGLLPGHGNQVRAIVLFCIPPGAPPGWEKAAAWRQATAMKGVTVFCDDGDEERCRFGPETSGHVLLYDPGGVLRFSGGITRARGQAGENPGRSAVESLLRGLSPPAWEGPVFGCPLVDHETPASGRGSR